MTQPAEKSPPKPRGRNGGRKPLPAGERGASLTLRILPAAIAALKKIAADEKRSVSQVVENYALTKINK